MSVKKNLQKKRDRVKRIRQDRARQSQLIDAQWNLDLAVDALRLRDYEKAGLHVEKALHLKPDWHHALRLKSMIALEIPKPDIATACSCLEKIVQKDPNDVITMFSLADCYFRLQRYADEISLLEGFLSRYKDRRSKDIDRYKKQAREWIRESKEYQEAERFRAMLKASDTGTASRAARFPDKKQVPTATAAPSPPETAGPVLPSLDLSPFQEARKFRVEPTIRFRSGDGDLVTDVAAAVPEDLTDYRLRLAYHRLRLLKDFEELLCLDQLQGVTHYWYQVETVASVLKRFRGRVLLADEVGLGKTIEAGMVIKEYLLRGLARKVLILTPPSLVSQWQEEMAVKFGLSFVTPDHEAFQGDSERFWREQDLVIASINTAKSQRHSDVVTNIDYDLVVVDEAHYLRNKKTLNHRLVGALRKRFLLLLSATPVQNNLIELYNLITLLQPGLLSTEAAFKRDYVKRGNLRQPNNPEQLRRLLKEVMIRNTRSMVDVKLPRRFATTLYVTPTEEERETYELLSTLTRLLHEKEGPTELLTIRNLQMAAGSSPFALRDALGHLQARLEGADHPIRHLLRDLDARLARIDDSAKGRQFLALVEQNREKKLIFVRYQRTLAYLAGLLRERGLPFAVFSGTMSTYEKDAAVEAFRREVPILLSTETGGEGRNIQFCNTMVNYDIPWNPMRLEQRIGRIHRIGQERDVFIFNLCLAGSIEDYMMRILDDKIHMFELVIGEIDTILGNLETDRDFSSLILDVWLRSGDEALRRENFARLEDEVIAAKKAYEKTKALDEMLFGDDYEV
ncbi:MAG TPA: SNF2-related protein [Syntrophales bacterium]|nr:SNF2-related protein [Syntrophales bacterium]HRT26912.1 SNF2-related protein [Syntrophales bacterium]HRT69785.1 SNF2-related protein [Syntrophales bacterium]